MYKLKCLVSLVFFFFFSRPRSRLLARQSLRATAFKAHLFEGKNCTDLERLWHSESQILNRAQYEQWGYNTSHNRALLLKEKKNTIHRGEKKAGKQRSLSKPQSSPICTRKPGVDFWSEPQITHEVRFVFDTVINKITEDFVFQNTSF